MVNGKKANILTENIIFIILNLVFLTILVLFVFSKAGGVAVLEEKYAKQIALIIDSAKPVMTIKLNMQDALEKKDKGFNEKIVLIKDNIVTVKLREKGGYSYSFFNDVKVDARYFDGNYFILKINKYNENE